MRKTKEAFTWIVGLLRKNKVPFQITGGLAARLYGSKRKLADIDIDIPEKYFRKIVNDVKNYMEFGPKKYKDKHWNLFLMTLNYKGQLIDICGIEHTKIFDHSRKKWIKCNSDLSKSKLKYFHGMRIPVEDKSELIEYKKKIWRKVDKEDVNSIT